jgi:hypothetical protein
MKRLGAIVLLLAVIGLAGCSQRHGAVYRVPIAETQRVLMATELPPFVFGPEPPACEVRAGENSDVLWIARWNGEEIFRYVAHLTEEGGGATRVSLELKGARGGDAGDVAKRLSETPTTRNLYLIAMNERIASALEHRPFRMWRLYPAMGAAIVVNMTSTRPSEDRAAGVRH